MLEFPQKNFRPCIVPWLRNWCTSKACLPCALVLGLSHSLPQVTCTRCRGLCWKQHWFELVDSLISALEKKEGLSQPLVYLLKRYDGKDDQVTADFMPAHEIEVGVQKHHLRRSSVEPKRSKNPWTLDPQDHRC